MICSHYSIVFPGEFFPMILNAATLNCDDSSDGVKFVLIFGTSFPDNFFYGVTDLSVKYQKKTIHNEKKYVVFYYIFLLYVKSITSASYLHWFLSWLASNSSLLILFRDISFSASRTHRVGAKFTSAVGVIARFCASSSCCVRTVFNSYRCERAVPPGRVFDFSLLQIHHPAWYTNWSSIGFYLTKTASCSGTLSIG